MSNPASASSAKSIGGIELDEDGIKRLVGDVYGLGSLVKREAQKIKAITTPSDYIKERATKLGDIQKNAVIKFKAVYDKLKDETTEEAARKVALAAANADVEVGLLELETTNPSDLAALTESALVKKTYGGAPVLRELGETELKSELPSTVAPKRRRRRSSGKKKSGKKKKSGQKKRK